MSGVVVRTIRPGDEAEISAMLHGLADHVVPGFVPRVTPEAVSRFGPWGAGSFQGLIAEIDGKPAGVILWSMLWSGYRGTSGAFINDLFVKTGHRGTGLGETLIAALVEREAPGYLKLDVDHGNRSAIRFYERLGFKRTGDDIAMIRELRA